MKILICDDEDKFLNDLSMHIDEYMENRFIDYKITRAFSPTAISSKDMFFDLAFLDIQMEGMDGITFAKKLKEKNSKIVLFFVTNYMVYQDDAMDLHAFRYFSKPIDKARLYSGLDKAMEYIDGAYVDIFLYGEHAHQRVLIDDILYITRMNRKVIVKTQYQELYVGIPYDDLCNKMPPTFFYPVHRSFFVNLHYIKKYTYTELLLTDGSRIPIAPRKQANFHKYWFEYLRRR